MWRQFLTLSLYKYSVFVNFDIKFCNSLNRLLKQPKTFMILQTPFRYFWTSFHWTLVLHSPPRLAFRNAKTLKDLLVRSKLKTTYEKPGVTICGRKNCEICHILHQGDTFESSNTGKQYKINFSFNCNSRNVVYLLTCKSVKSSMLVLL